MYFRRRIIAQIQCHKRPWERLNDAKPQMSQKSDFDRLTHSHMAHEWFPVAAFSLSHYAMWTLAELFPFIEEHPQQRFSVPTIGLSLYLSCTSISLRRHMIDHHSPNTQNPTEKNQRQRWMENFNRVEHLYIQITSETYECIRIRLAVRVLCMCGYASENHKILHSTNIIIILNTEIWLPLQTDMGIQHDQYQFLCMRVTGWIEVVR